MESYILVMLIIFLLIILFRQKNQLVKPLLRLYLNLILISFIIFFSYEFIYKTYFFKPSKETIEYFVTKLNRNLNIKNIQVLKVQREKDYDFNVVVAYQVDKAFCTSEIKIIYENHSWIGKKEKIEKCNRVLKI